MSESKVSEFSKLSDKFIELSTREQVLLFLAGVALIVYLLYTLLLEPTFDKTQMLNTNIIAEKEQQQTVKLQLEKLTNGVQVDLNIEVRQRIEKLNQEINALDEKLQNKISNLVPAKQMVEVLESVLKNSKDIKLIALNSIPPTPLYLGETNTDKPKEVAELYHHGVKLVFEGSYFAIQAYLEKLESLKWKFYWKKFEYKVEEYPASRVELEIFTVSTSKAFMGV
ncbi:type II secretion system protein GspM [Paraglaciecola sp. L3A3]|uniref:type II secretion system protein GspM n=1 Tax=Paraglaciecola sp. L3A3 TaxID=2686358 RepID=UPI00131C5EFD|nr:type II secretion system protein GspM [Paraglaciecola sp. L3A3]